MIEIPKINDISYSQLLTLAQNRAFRESKGVLKDFSRNNPLYVLISTLVWSGIEILFYANKFAERLAYTFLSILSDTPEFEGDYARCTVEFTLTSAVALVIPTGTVIQGDYQTTRVTFKTLNPVSFSDGQTTGQTLAEAVEIGTAYNIPTGILTELTQPFSFVQSVTNITPAFGVDPIDQNEFIEITLTKLRTRGLVSENDFVFVAEQAMGKGSVASAIPNLSADSSRRELGSVHLFLLDTELKPASQLIIGQVDAAIQLDNPPMLGTQLYYSPMEVLEIRLEITAKIDNNSTFGGISESIYNELVQYLNPINHRPGDDFNLRQFESRLWLIPGIITFEPITVNNNQVNISTDKKTKIVAQYAECTLINNDGVTQIVLIGAGESVYQN